MFKGILPIGSVVLLKNSTKRVMITGFGQREMDKADGAVWDYCGCVYPEGYMGPDQTFLFNKDQIEKIYAIGYQDEEQFDFIVKLTQIMEKLKPNTSLGEEENN